MRIYIDDNQGSTGTDADGYAVREYWNGPPSGPVTVTPVMYWNEWERHTPASVTIKWPAPEVLFYMEYYRRITGCGTYGTGNRQFNFPSDIVMDAAGYIYVLDMHNNRVQKLAKDWTFEAQWGSKGTGDGQFDVPVGMGIDALGYVYVADTYNHRIQKFTEDGTFVVQWGPISSTASHFYYPMGVAVDAAEHIYVVDTGHHSIQEYEYLH